MGFLLETSKAAASGDKVNFVLLCRLGFDGAERRMWFGHGQIEVAGELWDGDGGMASISEIGAAIGDSAQPLTIDVSGVDQQFMALAASEVNLVRGRPINISIAFFSESGLLLDSPASLYTGEMQAIKPSKTVMSRSLSLLCEGIFSDRGMTPNGLLSDRDQKSRHIGDTGMEFMSSLAVKQINWFG
jgi:hypothetical protein